MRRSWFKLLLVGGLGLAAGSEVGCAAERDPINRVQPQAIPKAFFIGKDYKSSDDDPEFYARTMLIDVPYGASETLFTNSFNVVTRIKWVIQEKEIVGRLSYERVSGADGKGALGPKSNDGQVVYTFPITSHFDIRRDYNAQTGEELNVVNENSTDRPWYERDYVRVDWSKNLVTNAYNFDSLALIGIYGGVKYDSLAFNVSDPNSADAPTFDLKSEYFDVTNKVFAQPEMIEFPAEWGGGAFPACMLPNILKGGTEPAGICAPTELKIRHSFRRVVDKDYEPEDWDGWKFKAYGAFYTERNGYARNFGLVDGKWYRFIERYNIWKRSHFYANPEKMTGEIVCGNVVGEDPQLDANQDGTVDRCEAVTQATGVGGSKCDIFKQRCTLPYAKREAAPIAWYHLGDDATYFDANEDAAREWDVALRIAVQTAKYAECKRTNGANCGTLGDTIPNGQFVDDEDATSLAREVEACRRGKVAGTQGEEGCKAMAETLGTQRGYSRGAINIAKADPMLVLCHSPVIASDNAKLCGPIGTTARMGDLRYNLVTSIDAPQTNSPWGIMTDANDPLSGEKVAASVNIWTHVNDLWSQTSIDVLRYIAGELSTKDVTDGTNVTNWVQAALAAQKAGGVLGTYSDAELKKRVAGVGGPKADPAALGKKPLDPVVLEKLHAVLARMKDTAFSADAPNSQAPIVEARRQHALGTDFEAQLVTPAMQQLAGTTPSNGAQVSPSVLQAASPLRGLNPQLRRQLERYREVALAEHGMCIMDGDMATAPLGFVALSDILQTKFGAFNPKDDQATQLARAKKMHDYLRRHVHYAVASHEMGHSIALRHNFLSSWDSMSFRPQYWQLRTNNKNSKSQCTAAVADGRTCVGPRRFDPITDNETNNLIQMWMQDSTMEYAGEPTQDLLGLGEYDYAAARMFYGGATSVYMADELKSTTALGQGLGAKMDDFGGILGLTYQKSGNYGDDIHYSQLDRYFNLILDCQAVDEKAFKPAHWNESRDGAWHPVLDGHIVTDESGAYSRCKQQPVDYVAWSALQPTIDDSSGRQNKPAQYDADKRTRVPYGFATDDWADLGNLSVYRHDNGADAYELMNYWIAQQEVNHIFYSYRRNRRDFSLYGVFNRSISRYHEKMRDAAKGLALFITIGRDTAEQYGLTGMPDNRNGDAVVAELLWNEFPDNALAATIAFDHFAHVFARPESGGHALVAGNPIYRSTNDMGFASATDALIIPNGVSGGFGNISLGGRPLENQLADNKGEYDRDYNIGCGSYYEKAFIGMLFAESADNFISSSRQDFYDPRFRAVSVADVLPDGYRRWLGNNLTGDDFLKGPRVAANADGTPKLAPDKTPLGGIGWTSWWPRSGPETCFPGNQSILCRQPIEEKNGKLPADVGTTVVIDPEVGWEQQKFLVAMTLQYIPENQRQQWLDQIRIWELGKDANPGIVAPIPTDPTASSTVSTTPAVAFGNRIEFHDPQGPIYIAKTFGTETIFGKTVQAGIGARMLEYANSLLAASYDTTAVTLNGTTWYVPNVDANGNFKVKNAFGEGYVATCAANPSCVKLQKYVSLLTYVRQALDAYGMSFSLKGVY